MNNRQQLMIRVGAVLALAVAAGFGIRLILSGRASAKEEQKGHPPAEVKKVIQESELNQIKLSSKAEERIGIVTAKVEKKKMPRTRVVGGEVMVPLGRESVVAAPLAGRLKAPKPEMPRPGQKVTRGEVLFELEPILGADARTNLAASEIEAEGQVKTEEKKVAAALIKLNRAERLVKEEAGPQRDVDDARAAHEVAQKALETAKAKRDLLKKALGDFETGAVAPLPIKAPAAGILRAVPVRSGQIVASGTTLFDVATLDRVWVRVPIYAGDAPSIRTAGSVGVNSLSEWGRPSRVSAEPVKEPPPSASALGVTIDLFYELKNPEGTFRPGQRVAVTLPLLGEEESLVVPWSAIEFDIHGGTWVYEKQSSHTYVRRRVRVLHVIGKEAVLASGPVPGENILVVEDKPVVAGMNIVIRGAAELFGAEVGLGLNIGGKGKVEDDD